MQQLGIVGESRAMVELFETLKRAAPHDSTVLSSARAARARSWSPARCMRSVPRAAGPFVAVNCATLPSSSSRASSSATSGAPSPARIGEARRSWRRPTAAPCSSTSSAPWAWAARRSSCARSSAREFRRVGGPEDRGRPPRDRRQQCRSRALRRDRPLPRRSLLPPQGRDARRAAAAASAGSDPAARRSASSTRSPRSPVFAPNGLTPEALAQLARYDWPGNVRELELHREPDAR